MAKRRQNVCQDCGYIWYPRGKEISLKCPRCGGMSTKVKLPHRVVVGVKVRYLVGKI